MTTRSPAKKPAARKPKPPVAPKEPLHGVPGLTDHVLRITEKAALRVALLMKHWRRALIQHA